MPGRQSAACERAVAHQLRTGCTPAAAAQAFGVAVSTVRRALARAGVPARPVGRPAAP